MNTKHYNYEIIIYDSVDISRLINICYSNNYNYAYIFHDKDENKPHYHFQLYFTSQRYINSISKEFDVPTNLITIIKDKKKAIQYLIHLNDDSKYQYSIEDICSNFNIDIYFSNKNVEMDDISSIIDYIDNQHCIIYYYNLMTFVLKNSIWSSYRRNYSIIKDIVQEHNLMFTNPK